MDKAAPDPLAMDSWHRERLLEALENFRKGLGDAPLLRKWSESGCPPASSDSASASLILKEDQANSMSFVLSTDEVDRHGDVIATGGWNLESYRKNPFFFGRTIMQGR